MTDEDFLTIYQTEENFIIISPRIQFSTGIEVWDEYCIISYETNKRYEEWLDAHPLLKALR
jgi:hypothetical protein